MMNLNATLIGEMLTFTVFVWFTMKYVWPPIVQILQQRQQKITEGLSAAEEGHKKLELAEYQAQEMRDKAKIDAAHIIEQANHRATHIVEEAKVQARVEGERLIQLAKSEIDQQYQSAKQELIKNVSALAVSGAEKILQREIDLASNDQFLSELVGEFE